MCDWTTWNRLDSSQLFSVIAGSTWLFFAVSVTPCKHTWLPHCKLFISAWKQGYHQSAILRLSSYQTGFFEAVLYKLSFFSYVEQVFQYTTATNDLRKMHECKMRSEQRVQSKKKVVQNWCENFWCSDFPLAHRRALSTTRWSYMFENDNWCYSYKNLYGHEEDRSRL